MPELSLISERQLATAPNTFTMLGDEFVETVGLGRWALPNLEPASGQWEFLPGSSTIYVESGWFVDGFIYDRQLSQPVRFCGHPALYASDVSMIDQGKPIRPVGTRLASSLNVLGIANPPTHQLWQYQLVTPASQPLQAGVFKADSVAPDVSKMRRWVRLQIVLPQTSSNDFANTRLLGKVRADLPSTIPAESLFQRTARGIATNDRVHATVIAQHLVVFTFSDSCVERLPQAPRIVASEFPVVVPAETTTKWPLKLSGDHKLKQLQIVYGNSLRYDEATQSLEIDPLKAREFNDARYQPLSRRFSPRATVEQWLDEMRHPTETIRQRLEQLSKQEIKGIPMAISFRLKAICEDGAEAELGGAIVADLHVELYREEFEKRQATRLARLQQPPPLAAATATTATQSSGRQTAASVDESTTPMDVAEVDPAIPQPPTAIAMDTPPDPAAVSIEPESFVFVAAETSIYVALSTLACGLILWLSCRFHRAGLPPEDHFEPPSLSRAVLVMLVLGVLFAGLESFAVVWGRGAIEVDGLPLVLVGVVSFLAAGFVRFLATTISVPVLLRMSLSDAGDVLMFFWFLAFIPQAALLGGWFAFTLP